jgi:chromosome partitioning protein
MGLIFSIASQKGGVGKTTTTVQLGIALAERNKKTLIIDADPQGGLMCVFQPITSEGSSSGESGRGLYDVFCGRADLSEITKPTLWKQLDYVQPGIGGEPSPWQAFEDANQAVGLLREALQQSVLQYDVILIDCPPGMGTIVTSALNASDYLIIPAQCEPLCLRTFPVFIQYLINLKNTWPTAVELAGIVMTMADNNEMSSKTVITQFRNYFDPDLIFPIMIPRDPVMNYLFINPLQIDTVYNNLKTHSPGIIAYQQLTDEMIRQFKL